MVRVGTVLYSTSSYTNILKGSDIDYLAYSYSTPTIKDLCTSYNDRHCPNMRALILDSRSAMLMKATQELFPESGDSRRPMCLHLAEVPPYCIPAEQRI